MDKTISFGNEGDSASPAQPGTSLGSPKGSSPISDPSYPCITIMIVGRLSSSSLVNFIAV